MRCDWSDLPVESCGHCRGTDPRLAEQAKDYQRPCPIEAPAPVRARRHPLEEVNGW